jgi:hypothetical protein
MARSIEAALSETLDEAFVRPIGCMERLFHLYAQEHPRHFCTVAEISGDIESLDFRRAFNDVQRRHPMLSAYIADDPQRGVPFSRPTGNCRSRFSPRQHHPIGTVS